MKEQIFWDFRDPQGNLKVGSRSKKPFRIWFFQNLEVWQKFENMIKENHKSLLSGRWLRSSVLENETHEHGEISTRLFCRRAWVLKKHAQRRKDPPYLFLMQVMYLSPFHWSGQGTHSSRLANLKQIVTGEEGGGGVTGSHFSGNWGKME